MLRIDNKHAILAPSGWFVIDADTSNDPLRFRDLKSHTPDEWYLKGSELSPPEHQHYVSASRVCLFERVTGWTLYDLEQRKIVRSLGCDDYYRMIAWYANGDCGVRVNDQQIEYFNAGEEWNPWIAGYVPNHIHELRCDERRRRVHAIANNTIYSYPLPTQSELDALSASPKALSRGGHIVDLHGAMRRLDTLALVHESDSWYRAVNDSRQLLTEIEHQDDHIDVRLSPLGSAHSDSQLRSVSSKCFDGDHFLLYVGRVSDDQSRVAFTAQARSESVRSRSDLHGREALIIVVNVPSGAVAWEGSVNAATMNVLSVDRSHLVVHVDNRVERIDLVTGQRTTPLDRLAVNAAASSNSGTMLATANSDTLSIWDADYSMITNWRIPQSHPTSVCWGQNDSRLLVGSDRAVYLCDPQAKCVLLSIRFREDGDNFALANSGDTLLLGNKLCSTRPLRERWHKWSETLDHEFSEREIAAGVVAARNCLGSLQGEFEDGGSFRARCVKLLRDNAALSTVQRFHAIRMLQEAADELRSQDAQVFKWDPPALLQFCQSRTDAPERFLFSDVLVGMAKLIRNTDESNLERSAAALASASGKKPDDPVILRFLAVGYYQLGDYRKCLSTLHACHDEALEELPAPEYKIIESICHFHLGDEARARELLDSVTEQAAIQPLGDEDARLLAKAQKEIEGK